MDKIITSLKFASAAVEIDGKQFTLRELTGAQRDVFSDFNNKRLVFAADGKITGINSVAGMQSKLISMCLIDAEGKAVSQETIEAWPASAVAVVFAAAKKMNKIGDEKEAVVEAKKD